MKPARIVLIDQPQFYNNVRKLRHDGNTTRFGMGASGNYSLGCMSRENIIRLGVCMQRISASDGYIFQWVTVPNSTFCGKLAGETRDPGLWGTEFKTKPFIWVKRNNIANTQFCGGGSYGFSNVEEVWLLRWPDTKLWHPNNPKYKPPQVMWSAEYEDQLRIFNNPQHTMEIMEPHKRYPKDIDSMEWDIDFHNILSTPCTPLTKRLRCYQCRACKAGKIVHSRKPESIQNMIDLWLDPYLERYTKVELFATRQRPGWICLGYDVTGNNIFDDLDELAWQILEAGYGGEVAYRRIATR